MKKAIIGTLGALAIASPAALAEVEAEFHVGYSNEYIFRGSEVGDDLFEYGLNLSGSCDCGVDWAAGIWYGAYDVVTNTSVLEDNELNIYLEASKDVGIGTVTLGYIHYSYEIDDIAFANRRNDDEIYLGLGTELGGIDLGAIAYYGLGGAGSATNDSWYFELTADKSIEISDKLSIDLGLKLGFTDGPDFNEYGQFTVSAPYAISEDITLSPYVSVVQNLSGDSNADEIFGGVSAAYSF